MIQNTVIKLRGFTIIELMIAIAIAGVLATLTVSSWDQLNKRTLRTEAKQLLYQISLDQQQYRTKNSTFNPNYQLSGENSEKFNLTINRSNKIDFEARLISKEKFKEIDPDCFIYTIEILNGKLNISSYPKVDCL